MPTKRRESKQRKKRLRKTSIEEIMKIIVDTLEKKKRITIGDLARLTKLDYRTVQRWLSVISVAQKCPKISIESLSTGSKNIMIIDIQKVEV